MSIPIYFMQLRGKIKQTEVVESERNKLTDSYKAYLAALETPMLTEYRDLENWVKSGAPAESKRAYEKMVFKGSLLHQQETEFRKLEKSGVLRNYFRLDSSRDLKRFLELRESDKLKAYYNLNDYIEKGEYEREKRDLEQQKFSGSPEERHLKELDALVKDKMFSDYLALHNSSRLSKHSEMTNSPLLQQFVTLKQMPDKDEAAMETFQKLEANADIKAYFELEKSHELRNYREVAGSHQPARYKELIELTNSVEFKNRTAWLQDKDKFEKSEARKKFKNYKTLQADQDVKFYLKFERSKLYRNYLDTRDSFTLKRYQELKILLETPEFQNEKAYLLDNKKWEKSEDYRKLMRYEELKKSPGIALVLKHEGKESFAEILKWEERFFESFDAKSIDRSIWTPNHKWAQESTGLNFSQPGDLHAYSGGANSVVDNRQLVLQVKGGQFRSYRWNPAAGLVPAEFAYSSDILSTYAAFRQEGGLFEAKIFYQPNRHVAQICYLAGDSPAPRIHLLEMGPKNRMGIIRNASQGHPMAEGVDLSYLKGYRWYIFGVEWERDQLRYLINGTEVGRSRFSGFGGGAHINLTSLVISDIPAAVMPVKMKVDWIRVSQRNE